MKSLLFLCFILCFQPAFAEENSAEDSSKSLQEEQAVEKIRVTGSRIKRIDLEGPSPVTIFTKEDLENSGYFSLSVFLANTSLSNFGEVLINNRSTLVLINGSRTIYDSSLGSALDLVPLSAIERVEILRDGASALYGSDVVGGVINIITKKTNKSSEVSLKLAPPFYPSYKWSSSPVEASFIWTKDFERGHFISTLQVQRAGPLKATDRPSSWFKASFLNFSPYPTFLTDGGAIVDPRCPKELKTETHCKYNLLPHSYIASGFYDFSSYNYGEYKLNSNLILYTQWIGSWGRTSTSDGAIAGMLEEIDSGHKMSLGQGSGGTLRYLFPEEELKRDDIRLGIFLEGVLGARTWISKTWDLDFSLKWSNIWKNRKLTGYPYLKKFKKAIEEGLYDPFDPSKRDLSSVPLHNAVYRDYDLRIVSSLDLSGELSLLDMDLAVGLQAYYNRYNNRADPKVKKGEIFGLAAVETGLLERNVVAGYLEGVKTFSDFLELQLAGRVDRYSDFGWTANPKLALRFQPLPQFLIRSSVGTSFEAPALSDLYTPTTSGWIGIFDTVACYNELKHKNHFQAIYESLNNHTQEKKEEIIKEFLIEQSSVVENENLSENVKLAFKELTGQLGTQTHCRGQSIFGTFKGNKDLKETRAITASLGLHWQVHRDHSLTVDYWWNSLKGSPLSSFATKKTIDAELRHGKKYVEDQGVQYERASDRLYNPIVNPVSRPINISGRNLSGLDLSWESSFPNWNMAGGFFYFKNDFSYVLKAGAESFPGMGFINNLGRFTLPKWRNFATFGWMDSKQNNITLVLKNTASVTKSYNEFESLPVVSLLDVFYQYILNEKTALKLGVYNALFFDPVIDDSIQQGITFDSNFYSLSSPYFFVELRRFL